MFEMVLTLPLLKVSFKVSFDLANRNWGKKYKFMLSMEINKSSIPAERNFDLPLERNVRSNMHRVWILCDCNFSFT